jgi:hypothetical protein
VVVAGDHPDRFEHGDPSGAGHDVMGRIGEVATLHHHIAGPAGPDQLGRLGHGRHAHELGHVDAGEGSRLPQVGGDHEGMGQQPFEIRRQPVRSHQRLPARGDQHRVDDEVGQSAGCGQVGHGIDDGAGGQHAGLDTEDVEIIQHGLDLEAHEVGVEGHHAADLGRVLCRDRGQRRRAVHAVGGEGLEVGLYAGATARVRAGDGQRRRRGGRVRHQATIARPRCRPVRRRRYRRR